MNVRLSYKKILSLLLIISILCRPMFLAPATYASDTSDAVNASEYTSVIADDSNDVIDESSAEEDTTTDEPVVDEPVVDEPVVDEPVVDEPVVDEPVVDEPVVDEPVADEPVVDEPVVDEPVVDEPVIDEPVVDEPAADEPVVDDTASVFEELFGADTAAALEPAINDDYTLLLDNTVPLTSLAIPMNEVLYSVAEALDVEIGCGDVEITLPDNADATYTLRIALTRNTIAQEQIALNNTEDYWVSQVTSDGIAETRAVAFSPSTIWGALATQISDIPAGATITIEDVLVTTGDGTAWGDYMNTFIYFEVVSSNSSESIVLDETAKELEVGATITFTIQEGDTDYVGAYVTQDTFTDRSEPYSDDDGVYSLLYMLNNYNVVSLKDIESTHIVGPIIAQEGAYRTGDLYTGASHDGSDLVASDYSRGISSYVGKFYTLEGDVNASALQLGYGVDDDDADFFPPHFYTRETEIDGDGFIVVSDVTEGWETFQYIHVSRVGGTFRSPNNHGTIDNYDASGYLQNEKTYTYQNDNFIDFEALWDALTEDSYDLLENGTLEGETEIITINGAGTYLEIEAGKSYLIKDATYLATVNIILPDDYDFFVNPYLPPTTISFEGSTINPAIYDGLLVSQFPETLINGVSLEAMDGANGEYSEVGNKIIWNLPNVVTTGNSNRLVTSGEGVNIAGHIVAVNAEFWNINSAGDWEGGNLNGAAVVKDFHSGNMEMHMWAYGGLMEQATYVSLHAEKAFPYGDLSARSFIFQLTSEDGLTELYAATNEEGIAYFASLVFETAGTYVYYMEEVIPEDVGSITYDYSQYKVVIEVDVETGTDDSGYSYVNYSNTVSYTQIADGEGNATNNTVDTITFTNTQQELPEGETVSYSFAKVDEAGYPLPGATFLVITTLDPEDNSDAWDSDHITDTQISGSGGMVTFENLAPSTTYYFKESVAPDGYQLPTGYWVLTVDEYGTVSLTAEGGALDIVENQLVNYLTDSSLAYVTLSKENQHGRGLEGAVFLVERVRYIETTDQYIAVDGGYSSQVTSDENGDIYIANLPLDQSYRITELIAPEGYMLPYDVSYWIFDVISDDSDVGYSVALYAVDDDGSINKTELDNSLVLVNWDVYILPATGGGGTVFYYLAGFLLCSAGLWYIFYTQNKKRRKIL